MAWMSPSNIRAGHGSVVRVSLVTEDDTWKTEPTSPPIHPASVHEFPVQTKSAAVKPTRASGRPRQNPRPSRGEKLVRPDAPPANPATQPWLLVEAPAPNPSLAERVPSSEPVVGATHQNSGQGSPIVRGPVSLPASKGIRILGASPEEPLPGKELADERRSEGADLPAATSAARLPSRDRQAQVGEQGAKGGTERQGKERPPGSPLPSAAIPPKPEVTPPPAIAPVARHAEGLQAGAAAVELPRMLSESIPLHEQTPPAPLHVAEVPAKESHATLEPQDHRETSVPFTPPEQTSQTMSSPRSPAVTTVPTETTSAPLRGGESLSLAQRTESAEAPPPKPSTEEAGPTSPSPKTQVAKERIDRPREASRSHTAVAIAPVPADGGRSVAGTSGDSEIQGRGRAREQGQALAVEQRRQGAEGQGNGLAEARTRRGAEMPAGTAAAQADERRAKEGSEIRAIEPTSAAVIPTVVSRAETNLAHSSLTQQESRNSREIPTGIVAAERLRPLSESTGPSQPKPTPPAQAAEGPVREVPAPGPAVARHVSAPAASPPETDQTGTRRQDPFPGVGIHIERPHAGTTDQGIQALVGRVSGGAAKAVVIHMNETQHLLDLWGDRFEGEVGLRRGSNRIRVVAMGPRGPLAEKSVEVQYVPPAPSPTIRILRPADGAVFGSPDQDLIEVEGEVSEPGLSRLRIVFNEFAVPAAVRDGRFSVIVPAIAPEITIWAEAHGERGVLGSDSITVHRRPYKATRGYVLLHLPTPSRKVDARLWILQRAKPADPDNQGKVTSHFPLGTPEHERTSILFAFPSTQGGAYVMALDYRIPSGESVEKGWAVVFIPSPSGHRSLRLGPLEMTGKKRVTLARFLLPHGIYWEEDSWFTGTAEGAESLTKFRYSDGVSWTERKGEPEFPIAR